MKCSRCFFTDRLVDEEACRRCSRNLTGREVVELVVLGVVYVLVCRLSGYLFTGDFVGHLGRGGVFSGVPFADTFANPVNLAEHPWHVLTVGWTFAIVLTTPVLAAVFYGPVAGVVLALVGGYFVVVPFFLVLLALAAVVAGTRVAVPARHAVPLLGLKTALVAALVVPVLYLLALTFGTAFATLGSSAFIPWLAAAGIALVQAAFVMIAAKRRDHNASFLPWTVAAQGAVVFVVFYASVGFSKVEYEFLRQPNAATGARFHIPVLATDPRRVTEQEREAALREFESRRAKALKEFSRFLSWFPRSPETPMARFERADVYNLRPAFRGTVPDQVHGYTDRISREALKDYRTIREDFPTTLVAVEARLRSGRYYLQHAEFDNGLRELRDLVDFCDVKVPREYRPPTAGSVLQRWRSHRLSSAEETQLLYEVLQEARAEIRFTSENFDYLGIPLKLYYQIDLHDPSAPERIRTILKWFPDSRLADNLRLALLERGRWTPDEMKTLYERYPTGDAAPRMLLLLGTYYWEKRDRGAAGDVLGKLATEFPDSYEAARAGVLLRTLAATGKRD